MATAKTTAASASKSARSASVAKTQASKADTEAKETAKKETAPQNGLEPLTLERLNELKGLSLNDAFTLAQASMDKPKMSGLSEAYKKNGEASPYSTLKDYLDVIVPACNSFGISFSQPTTSERVDGQAVEYLLTEITKGDEREIKAKVELMKYQDEKQRGRVLTYFRRQSAATACGLAGELDNSEDIPSTETVIPNYYPSERQAEDPEAKRREEVLHLEDRLAEMEERRTVAKSMGLTAEGYKSWFRENIKKSSEKQMTLEDIEKTINFLNQNIADFAAIKEMSEEQTSLYDEDVDF